MTYRLPIFFTGPQDDREIYFYSIQLLEKLAWKHESEKCPGIVCTDFEFSRVPYTFPNTIGVNLFVGSIGSRKPCGA